MSWIARFEELSVLDAVDREFLDTHTRIVMLEAGQCVFAPGTNGKPSCCCWRERSWFTSKEFARKGLIVAARGHVELVDLKALRALAEHH